MIAPLVMWAGLKSEPRLQQMSRRIETTPLTRPGEMAAPGPKLSSSPTVRRARSPRLPSEGESRRSASPRHRPRLSSVTFGDKATVYPITESPDYRRADDEEALLTPGKWKYLHSLITVRRFRHFFRLVAVVNILSLVCSAPFTSCPPDEESCKEFFPQFIVITTVDFILSILYTIHSFARISYALHIRRIRKTAPQLLAPQMLDEDSEEPIFKLPYSRSLVAVIAAVTVTTSLWCSFAIGIFRSVRSLDSDPIPHELYLLFVPRSLAIFSAMKLFVPLKLPYSALQGLVKNIKWKQLAYVTLFYLFFIYLYALLGVQWIGGLNNRCVYNSTSGEPLLAIPVTHCDDESGTKQQNCYNDPNHACMKFPEGSTPLNVNFRSEVYFGQFRVIVDALYAVYEASSLELWAFMASNAVEGAPRSMFAVVVFFFLMVFFLVVVVQQSIFLVVILESFADLRSDSAIGTATKTKDKPLIVLYETPGSSEEKLRLQAMKAKDSTEFSKKMAKYYFSRVEKFFLVLVLMDAIVTSLKYTGMPPVLADILRYCQLAVSIAFLIEAAGVVIVHLYSSQYRLLLRTPYYWYLVILAVGGLVAAIPIYPFYDPLRTAHAFALFQSLRLPRLLRLNDRVRKFFFKIIGDGTRLLVVILLNLVFLVWFAVINMQFFGYLPVEEECTIVEGQFRNFFISLQSMFQLVMQEGWTQLTSEVMCLRTEWWAMNFYFIVLHLFASLILLNFFVAVILDNLDYDEEKKKKKLEQELTGRKIPKVPKYLKLVTFGGPKKIPVPKLSSASGIEAPNLTEADVKHFYDTGDVAEFSTNPYPSENPPIVQDLASLRRSSELSGLTLLSSDSSSVPSSDIPTHQGKLIGVQGILNYVKAFRQRSREQQEARPGQDAPTRASIYDYRGTGSQFDTSSLIQSEYDEYRQKYRLFDNALFCMPPDHKLRKFCSAILTSQLADPAGNPSYSTRPDQLRKIVANRIAFTGRYLVSRLPYFTWFMFLLTWASIGVQMIEYTLGFELKTRPEYTYIWFADLIFITFTLLELILKILANGCILNPNAAIRSLWDVIDWLILLCTLAVMTVYISICDTTASQYITFRNIPVWMRILLVFRALRPLRIISLVPVMRRVVWDVVLGWRKFLLGAILLIFFIFMFASLGVQLFAGDNFAGPQGFCNDPKIRTPQDCVGEFDINILLSRELLPIRGDNTLFLVPRVWYRHRRDFSFDNTAQALLTLFEVLTLEGWLDVRDMFREPVSGDDISNQSAHGWYLAIYLHVYVFFGVNLGLQLFVGIVVNNFNAHKPDHSALLTISQKRWTDLIQRISLTRPIKQPPEPRHSHFRLILYKMVVSKYYRHVSTASILLNSLTFVIPWSEEADLETATRVMMSLSIVISVYFILQEVCLKMLAFGPVKYFHSWRNTLDFLLGLFSVAYIISALLYLIKPETIKIHSVTDFAVVLAVFKCFTILGKYSIMQNLSITVAQTIFKIVPLIGVFLATILSYAFAAIVLFSDVRTGEEFNFSIVNFNGIFVTLALIVRVMTGEDWHHLLRDAMVQEPFCSEADGNCGNQPAALIWFISYYVLVTFIFLNIIVAVVLENFSIFYNEDDTELNHALVSDFKQKWHHFDKNATGFISASKIKLFLRMLRLQRLYTYQPVENGLKERRPCNNVLSDALLIREMAEELNKDQGGRGEGPEGNEEGEGKKEGKYSFQNVLKTIAYRAEDISKRLEPQELYNREELEESVQFDVAEDCILRWIKQFVKPVIVKLERQRRQTVSCNRKPLGARKDESIPSWALTEDNWHGQHSFDTEEESEPAPLPLTPKPRLKSVSISIQRSTSQEEDNTPVTDVHEHPLVTKSYARLAQTAASTSGYGVGGAGIGGGVGRDKWHDWFKMQREWMDNVEQDTENYFDDYL